MTKKEIVKEMFNLVIEEKKVHDEFEKRKREFAKRLSEFIIGITNRTIYEEKINECAMELKQNTSFSGSVDFDVQLYDKNNIDSPIFISNFHYTKPL